MKFLLQVLAVSLFSTFGMAAVPKGFLGDWLLVNGLLVLHVSESGEMTLRNTGGKGPIELKGDGSFTWALDGKEQSGRFDGERMWLKNDQADAPRWIEFLEFRRAGKEAASEIIEHALRQQTQAANAFATIRRSSMEKAILNNLRQLAAAADMYFLEHGVDTVTFDQIVGPDTYIRELNAVDGEDYRALDLAMSNASWRITSDSGIVVSYER